MILQDIKFNFKGTLYKYLYSTIPKNNEMWLKILKTLCYLELREL